MSDYGFDPVRLQAAGVPVFLVGETYARNVLTQAGDDPPRWVVMIGLNGKWNHGAEDRTVHLLAPDNAIAVATSLIGAALACGRDEAVLAELDKLLEVFGGKP